MGSSCSVHSVCCTAPLDWISQLPQPVRVQSVQIVVVVGRAKEVAVAFPPIMWKAGLPRRSPITDREVGEAIEVFEESPEAQWLLEALIAPVFKNTTKIQREEDKMQSSMLINPCTIAIQDRRRREWWPEHHHLSDVARRVPHTRNRRVLSVATSTCLAICASQLSSSLRRKSPTTSPQSCDAS